MPNKLIDEQSPYLLQHAHNPVEWYPWGDEAFNEAKKQNKPLLVSIGYAACHWCHVMERESFEDEATAAYMNEHFINVKVDREEHPDVDHMYMDAVQAITGQGGWPLNVFVTPERMPFYGGTYFPPQSMYNRPSWMQVLENINQVWVEKQGDVQQQILQMTAYLKQLSEVAIQSESKWSSEDVDKVADGLLGNSDKKYGGFGKAPKFPATMSIRFLLEHYHYTGKEASLEHTIKSLDALIHGGIYDQIGGGLARYSTDDYWLAPHFEKMLYDNALLVTALCDGYSVTKYDRYKKAIEETIAFINRELLNKEGGFFSALDADSEGVEGKYYTWTWDEWSEIIKDNIVQEYYGVTKEGNWEGTNILHIATTAEALVDKYEVPVAELNKRVHNANEKLIDRRNQRERPLTDDKSLLSWNALMNTALSKASVALGRQDYKEQAAAHMQWMIDAFFVDGTLMHTYKNNKARILAKLDDLAYLVEAMLELGSVTSDSKWLTKATEIMSVVQQNFLHSNKSFYYYSSAQQKDIPVRKTDLYDNALPSANSIMANNLIVLGMLSGSYSQLEQGVFMLQKMQSTIVRYPGSFANWAIYAQRFVRGNNLAVVDGVEARKCIDKLLQNMAPHTTILHAQPGEKLLKALDKKADNDGLSVFICDIEKCLPPLNDIEKAKKIINKGS